MFAMFAAWWMLRSKRCWGYVDASRSCTWWMLPNPNKGTGTIAQGGRKSALSAGRLVLLCFNKTHCLLCVRYQRRTSNRGNFSPVTFQDFSGRWSIKIGFDQNIHRSSSFFPFASRYKPCATMCSIGKWNGSQARWALAWSCCHATQGSGQGIRCLQRLAKPSTCHCPSPNNIKCKGKKMLVICLMDSWKKINICHNY